MVSEVREKLKSLVLNALISFIGIATSKIEKNSWYNHYLIILSEFGQHEY